MPKPRKKKEQPTEAAAVTVEATSAVATAVAEPPAEQKPVKASAQDTSPSQATASEKPPFDPTGSYTPTDQPKAKERFRSWVTDNDRGYTRLTDVEEHRIVLRFNEKPPVAVLTAIKDGGFHYQPDYLGQKNAWVRRDNFEGRMQVEGIEKLLREVMPGKSWPDRS